MGEPPVTRSKTTPGESIAAPTLGGNPRVDLKPLGSALKSFEVTAPAYDVDSVKVFNESIRLYKVDKTLLHSINVLQDTTHSFIRGSLKRRTVDGQIFITGEIHVPKPLVGRDVEYTITGCL